MSRLKTILFYYNLVFIFILLIIGIWTRNMITQPALMTMLVPLIIYFYGFLIVNSSPKVKESLNKKWFWVFVFLLLAFNLLSTLIVAMMNTVLARGLWNFLIAALYFPFPIYFILTIYGWYQTLTFGRETKVLTKLTVEPAIATEALDNKRRQFLKLVGGTSLSLIVLSLLNPSKAGAAFFGSVPGPGTVSLKDATGAKINPAEKQPTDGYKISQIDDANYPYYYGYVNATGAWYIMSEDSSSNFRYTKGSSSFSSNWTSRTGLTYDYFDNVF